MRLSNTFQDESCQLLYVYYVQLLQIFRPISCCQRGAFNNKRFCDSIGQTFFSTKGVSNKAGKNDLY